MPDNKKPNDLSSYTIERYLDILKKPNDEEHYTIAKQITNANGNFQVMYFNSIHSLLDYSRCQDLKESQSITSDKYQDVYKNEKNEKVGNEDGGLKCINDVFSLNNEKQQEFYVRATKGINGSSTLKDFCFKIINFAKIDEGDNGNKEKTRKDSLKEYIKLAFGFNVDDRLIKNKLNELIENGTKQIILHGAPGTGKTFTAEKVAEEYVAKYFATDETLKKDSDQTEDFKKFKDKYIKKVQFHPSFDYTDFVEGLRPAIIEKDKTDKSNTKTDKSPTFVRMDGILKKFCRTIINDNEVENSKDKDRKYFLLIDEINRADLSKVLGDLMYLMNDPQRSKKDKDEKKKIETPYSNMPTYVVDDNGNGKFLDNQNEDKFHDGFYLPDNLIIIGTMNDIDRSVDAFDFALRRRFVWIEADANTEAKEAIKAILENKINKDKINKDEINKDEIKKLSDRLEELNKVISGEEGKKLGLSEKYHIGHAYAKNFDGSYDTLWENSIKPVLEDYCLGKKNKETFITACRSAFVDGKNPQDNQASSGN